MKKYNDFILEFVDPKISRKFDAEYDELEEKFMDFWTLLDDKLDIIKKTINSDEQDIFNQNEAIRKNTGKKPRTVKGTSGTTTTTTTPVVSRKKVVKKQVKNQAPKQTVVNQKKTTDNVVSLNPKITPEEKPKGIGVTLK